MEIKEQMTATVRLTKAAAERLRSFLKGLRTQPKNMNDALNIALSALPTTSFIDEIIDLQRDERQSLIDIRARYRSIGQLKRSDYYFMVLMAKDAAQISKRKHVYYRSIEAVLNMTLALWSLCKTRDTDDLHGYMLGNISGNGSDAASQALETHIPAYIERSKNHPYPATLELALRNLEAMLRNNFTDDEGTLIHEQLHKYFDVLHGMAVRCVYLKTKLPLMPSEANAHFPSDFSGRFGAGRVLHFIHHHTKNFSFMITFKHMNVAANNILQSEEFFDAFTPLDKSNLSYNGEILTLIHDHQKAHFDGGFLFQTNMLQTSISREEYDQASHAIAEMLSDHRVQVALNETYEQYGAI